MGLNIRIHDINVPSSFELFYKTGNTPGNMTVIENGYTKFGGTYPSSSSRDYSLNPIVFTGATYNTQYWFKIQYTGVTGQENSVGYIIENIKTHQPVGHIYYALHCCDFSGGTAAYYTGCTFSGGTVVYGSNLDPTPAPTSTAAPTPTPTPSPSATLPDATPIPTNTLTPTPTPTLPTAPSCGLTSGELPWYSYYNTNPAGTVVNNSGVTLYIWLGAAAPAGSGDTFSSNSPYSSLTVSAAGGGGYSYSSSYVTLSNGQSWPYNITRTSGSDTSFDVNLYWSTSPTGTKYAFSCLPPTATPTETVPGATSTPTPTPTLSQTPDATPGPTATPDPTALPGTCYEMVFSTSLTGSTGQPLYICYQKTDNTYVCEPYYQYVDSGENTPDITINVCSKTLPSIKYGYNGTQMVPDAGFNLIGGSGCIVSSDCGGNDPLPPPPTATAEVILNANGLCYRWSVDDGNNNSGTTVTYTPLHLNTTVTFNVNNVESDTEYYYICTKTTPNFVVGDAMVLFPYVQDGACNLVDGAYSGCQAPLPDPTPGPTPDPTACPADGTFISSTCDGTTLITTYADGNCGTRTVSTENDSSCTEGGGSGGGY
jgi:hypothetical protein